MSLYVCSVLKTVKRENGSGRLGVRIDTMGLEVLRYLVYVLAFFFVVRCGFRAMGTPQARNLISVR